LCHILYLVLLFISLLHYNKANSPCTSSLHIMCSKIIVPYRLKKHGGILFSHNLPKFVAPDPGTYTINDRILTYASKIFFIDGNLPEQRYCVKMWHPRDDRLYQTMDSLVRAKYLLEGFHFNNKHAPGVYVGIASVQLIPEYGQSEDQVRAITLLSVLTNPQEHDLEDGKEYALVMGRLNDKLQLRTLLQDTLANKEGMEVVARQIALMHQLLSKDPHDITVACQIGSVAALSQKLALNISLFCEALASLTLPKGEEVLYKEIASIISSAYVRYQSDFVRREKDQRIRRCHGDLKATNLWFYLKEKGTTDFLTHKVCLLALDCIDFKPSFCHIDTLSDVAMLAIDIEFYLTNDVERVEDGLLARTLATHFLETYLKQAQEQETNVWHLLNYYMLEKAMIGMYGNILNDNHIEAGKRYLFLAYTHAIHLSSLA
jgi:aminoglycoside phosphotransferase family enzyme